MAANMTVARIQTVAFSGIETVPVDVQVHFGAGLPSFAIVGLADKAVTESRERVRAALSAIGLALPAKKITVNLSPADLAKEGSHYDLPIALGLLVAMEILPEDMVATHVVMGELALDGSITGVTGVLPAAIYANSQNHSLICPEKNGQEALWAGELSVLAAPHLLRLIHHIKGTQLLPEITEARLTADDALYPDLKDIKGQESAKRALEIAAAGGHNLLMMGPPGAGKSMLASRLPGILPPMQSADMLEATMVASIAGQLKEESIIQTRPFRDPHHNCSMPAMIGGGTKAKPGEITLAHKGVLFLDELPEFPRQVLDALRQPLETREVSIARAEHHVTYPAHFQLIAAMNPCRCGYLDDAARACSKAPKCASDYQSKLSGPLLDRFDMHIEVPAVKPQDIYNASSQEDSAAVAMRVHQAREMQAARYEGSCISTNAEADGDALAAILSEDEAIKTQLVQASDKFGLSMRGLNRSVRVARTIADLEGAHTLTTQHLTEALSYRQVFYNYT